MKIKDVIVLLQKFNQDDELIVYSEYNLYPILDISNFEGSISIDCGGKMNE